MTELLADPAPAASDPCRACGHALAPDQRYCLNCGTRRGDARVDYLRETGATRDLPPVPVVVDARPSLVDRAGGPAGIAATLLAAVGIGFLIGRADDDGSTRTVLQRAPVVNVQAPAGAGGVAVAPTGTTGAVAPPSAGAGAGAGSGTGSRSHASTPSKPAAKALSKALTKQAAAATKAAQSKIKNAPKVTSTGGQPPKKDGRKPGGGSSAESIG